MSRFQRVPASAKAIWIVSGLFVAVLGALVLLRVATARPTSAIQHAQSFVDNLCSHELARAYQLTTRRGEVGGSFQEFQGVVRQQWPGNAPAAVRFLEARPRQSYGNRLRRWLRGQAADPSEMWLEFSVDGVPFGVRETRAGGGEWKVDSFQSHAG